MVTVGDQDLLVGEQRAQPVHRRRRGDHPQAMANAVRRRRVHGGRAAGRLLEDGARGAAGVAIEAEHRRDLRVRRAQQPLAVLLRRRQRLLVRQHDAPLERFQANGGEESTPRVALAAVPELLLVEIEGVARFGLHDAFRYPRHQQARGRRVAGVIGAARQLQTHDVLGMACLQLAALVLVDHVVRRAEHRREVADPVGRKTKSGERRDFGHRA